MTDPRDPFVPLMATQLLSCLSIAVSGVPGTPQHIGYRVGTEITHDAGIFQDQCCEGIAYVALGDSWPTKGFPQMDDTRQANSICGPPAWGLDFKIGIIRCIVVGDLQFPPSDAEWASAFVQNMWDEKALRQAQCCFRTWVKSQTDALLGMSIVLNRHIQTTPNGGCVERYATIQVQFPNCEC